MAGHRTIEFTENIIQGWDAIPAVFNHSSDNKKIASEIGHEGRFTCGYDCWDFIPAYRAHAENVST